jgi:hypothetical protein
LRGDFFAEMSTLDNFSHFSRGAESVNAGINLTKKLSQLKTARQTAVKTRFLPDGRIRYYDSEKLASTIGPTRGMVFIEWLDVLNVMQSYIIRIGYPNSNPYGEDLPELREWKWSNESFGD